MTNQELCFLLETILELIKSGNADRAAKTIEHGIKRIDKSYLADETDDSSDSKDRS
ncbi:MAG: hypothetical protein IK093_18345 [Ruminiclostridium sp.]|nr:hypothetical protein [Ruminiclostridium sp.]